MKLLIFIFSLVSLPLLADKLTIIPHEELTSFTNYGNELSGIATKSLGADSIEVWKSTIAPNSCTPKHVHNTQEIFVFLKGEGKIELDGQPFFFKAPCTVLCPANIPHQIFNTGDEPTEQLAIMSIHSEIKTMTGELMQLPWRK